MNTRDIPAPPQLVAVPHVPLASSRFSVAWTAGLPGWGSAHFGDCEIFPSTRALGGVPPLSVLPPHALEGRVAWRLGLSCPRRGAIHGMKRRSQRYSANRRNSIPLTAETV